MLRVLISVLLAMIGGSVMVLLLALFITFPADQTVFGITIRSAVTPALTGWAIGSFSMLAVSIRFRSLVPPLEPELLTIGAMVTVGTVIAGLLIEHVDRAGWPTAAEVAQFCAGLATLIAVCAAVWRLISGAPIEVESHWGGIGGGLGGWRLSSAAGLVLVAAISAAAAVSITMAIRSHAAEPPVAGERSGGDTGWIQ